MREREREREGGGGGEMWQHLPDRAGAILALNRERRRATFRYACC